ncbi:MAG: hypothetical protein KKD38_10550 [Candidatus Delongbacteria bacterium]|nr:hypothetical protein [Candidatus Delongbacteria bacterium]MCG2760100.1 hypothetical protein [Candidatus Delongbacteria bacterium]
MFKNSAVILEIITIEIIEIKKAIKLRGSFLWAETTIKKAKGYSGNNEAPEGE